MGFNDLPPIEKIDVYMDNAFAKARKNAREHTLSEKDKPPLNRARTLTLIKLDTVQDYLNGKLSKLIATYPNFDNLTEFYKQLLRSTMDFNKLKKAMGAMNWAVSQIRKFSSVYRKKIKGGATVDIVNQQLPQYYGRISSVLKQIDKELQFLHEARQIMRTYPAIKEDAFTIAIAGFPNVGKSTLLSKLTPAKPEIDAYAFTTKKLNQGYATTDGMKLQYIDTPGTLNRLDKMNPIEKQAYLAVRYAADLIIYVYDLTEDGYPLKDQQKLLKRLKEEDKTIICYLSKTDLLDELTIEQFERTFAGKKIPLCTTIPELKDAVKSQARAYYG